MIVIFSVSIIFTAAEVSCIVCYNIHIALSRGYGSMLPLALEVILAAKLSQRVTTIVFCCVSMGRWMVPQV